MQNDNDKWLFVNSDFKSARGAYYAGYGMSGFLAALDHSALAPKRCEYIFGPAQLESSSVITTVIPRQLELE